MDDKDFEFLRRCVQKRLLEEMLEGNNFDILCQDIKDMYSGHLDEETEKRLNISAKLLGVIMSGDDTSIKQLEKVATDKEPRKQKKGILSIRKMAAL